jgi:putative ABC transport system substrate-binding protein
MQFGQLKRREFVSLLGGATAWPIAGRAQQPDRMRRIAVLMGSAGTALDRGYVAMLSTRLEELGWKDGRNIRTDLRWWTGGPEQMQPIITDMLASSPDVAVVFTNLALAVLKPLVGNVPVVFVGVGDPVGSGFVASLPRPGGNITGFASHEASMGGKWLEVLKETAPRLTRILAIVHPETPVHRAFWRSIQDAAPRLGVQVMSGEVHDGAEIEGAILSFAEKENSGVVALPHALTQVHRDLIVALALRHRLPTIYATAGSVQAG